MKTLMTTIICVIAMNVYSQDIEIGYIPEQREGITDEKYNKGKKALEYVYKNLKKEYKLTQSTYWNLAAGFNYMGEEPEHIYNLLVSAKKVNPKGFCIVMDVNLHGRDIKSSPFYKTIGDRFLNLVADCNEADIKPETLEELFAKKESLDLTGLNEPLIDRLILLMEKDRRYRGRSMKYMKENKEAWIKLDTEARADLIKIFEEYGYAGKDIVGEKYQDYMCLFLEHVGKLNAQEKYLPLVVDAYKNKQLTDMPLKMLIDRIYSTKTNTQIFGSHGGVPYADDKTIAEVKEKYGLLDFKQASTINVGSNKIIIQKN